MKPWILSGWTAYIGALWSSKDTEGKHCLFHYHIDEQKHENKVSHLDNCFASGLQFHHDVSVHV
jgi:hypothetical protein